MSEWPRRVGWVVGAAVVGVLGIWADSANEQLSPFVTNKIKAKEVRMLNQGYVNGRMRGRDYLAQWKEENGTD